MSKKNRPKVRPPEITPSQLQLGQGLEKLKAEQRAKILKEYCDRATVRLVKRKLITNPPE